MKIETLTYLEVGIGNFACAYFGCNKRSDYGINIKKNWEYEKTYCKEHFKLRYPDKTK